MHMPYLSVRGGKVTAQFSNTPLHPSVKSKHITVLETPDDFIAWARKEAVRQGLEADAHFTFMCSSSMDFPEDDTDDPKVIALAQWIRRD